MAKSFHKGSSPPRMATFVGLNMPAQFSTSLYNALSDDFQVWRAKHPTASTSWQDDWGAHFASGWQGIAFRFMDCTRHHWGYTRSSKKVGPAPDDPHERYVQDRELFGFFVTGQAVLENLHYAIYALGAGLDDATFSAITTAKAHTISTELVAKRLSQKYPQTALAQTVSALLAQERKPGTMWHEWRRVRNILPHRMAPGLHMHLRIDSSGTHRTVSWWAESVVLDANTTASRLAWLATTLRELLAALYLFSQNYA